MQKRILLSLVAVAVVALLQPFAGGQSAAQLGAAPISHVGVVVRDVAAATKHFADVMGVPAPRVMDVKLGLPDGSTTDLKYATVQFANLLFEFEQPVSPKGPLHEHLQRVGQGLHHIGFVTPDSIDEKRAFLESKGGRWVGGTKGGTYAFVDMKDTLGATIEIVKGTGPRANAPAPVAPPTPAPLGQRAFTHVGIAVTNTDATARAWAEALGTPMPTVRDYKDAQYPPGNAWSTEAYIRLTSWKHANVGIELLGAVGRPNPWSDYIERYKGSTIQHIALPVGPRMTETIAELQKKGGTWTNGKEGGSYAYLDFIDSFGLAFEINGTAAPAK